MRWKGMGGVYVWQKVQRGSERGEKGSLKQ